MTAQFDFLIRNYNFPLCHIDYIRTVVFSILLLWILSKKSSRKTLDYDLKTLSFNLGLHHYLAYVWLWNLSNNVIFSKLIFLSSTEDSVKKSANICSLLAYDCCKDQNKTMNLKELGKIWVTNVRYYYFIIT